MDKEQEKIRQDLIDSHLWFADGDLKYLAQYLAELGYRKLPKDEPPLLTKPPLLTGDTVRQFWVEKSNPSENHWDLQGLLQAQREADIKFYEGK